MNTSLEYIAAGIIMCLILGVTGKYTTGIVYDKVNQVEKNQGLEKAGKLLDLILLTEGIPSDWDENTSEPDILGFAFSNSIKMYQLDKEKVLRLSPVTPNYISSSKFKELMGLGSEYYISLKIYPLFNLTLSRKSMGLFETKVLNQWGTPMSNINITAAYIPNKIVEEISEIELDSFLDFSLDAINDTRMTNSLGLSELNLSGAEETGCILILAKQLTCECLFMLNLDNMNISYGQSPNAVYIIDSTMGSVSGYNVEVVCKNVKIDDFDYIARFTLWK
jgi:hypothetical protein